MEQRHVADHHVSGPAGGQRGPGGEDTTPSMPFAPRPERKATGRSPAGKNASTSRTGME